MGSARGAGGNYGGDHYDRFLLRLRPPSGGVTPREA